MDYNAKQNLRTADCETEPEKRTLFHSDCFSKALAVLRV